jgi:DNA-directed RNA polymerase specialized sigma24 family protein
MASLASPSRRQQQHPVLSSSALQARDALVLEHLPLADAIASVMAQRLFLLVERDDHIQVAREALVSSAERCRSGEPAEPYLRRCITGALHHHLRDRVRLVRISRRQHEQSTCPLGHASLDVCPDGETSLLDQLEAPAAELALEQLVEQLPAAQATALRPVLRPVPSAHAPWLVVDRPHHRPQRRRDLQLLFGPLGRQGCQEAASVAVNTEHGVS